MSTAKTKAQIAEAYGQLEGMYAHLSGFGRDFLGKAYQAARLGEQEHYAFGRRLTGTTQRAKASIDTRAMYFVVKWALEPSKPPVNWVDVAGYRDDCRWAFAVRDACLYQDPMGNLSFVSWADRWRPVFEGIDYARDLSSGTL